MVIDRLSELPESLILEILSRLPMREVVATMLLSKRWKNLWTTVPCLQFHSESDGDDLLKFKRFVSGALALWKGDKILSLSFRFNMDTVDTDLDSWLDFAVKKQVEDLCVDSTCVPYDCPDFVYSCSSLKKLTLNVVTFHVYESVKWNRLKSLTLQRPEPYSEEEMDRIFKGAPLLESLNLTTMENLSNFAIRSKGLKALTIDYIQYDSYFLEAVLTIDAPNLESLEISGIWHTKCSMNAPSLKTAILGFDNRDNKLLLQNLLLRGAKKTFRTAFRSISHVQNLTLNEWSFKLLVNQMKNQFSVLFPNAKSLKLCTREAEGIPLALSIFPALETLIIDHREFGNFLVAQKTSFPSLPLPHLKRVYISWEVLDGSMIGVVKSLIENDRVLDKLVLRLMYGLVLRLMYGDGDNRAVYDSTAIRVILMIRPSLNPTLILSNIDFLEGCLRH